MICNSNFIWENRGKWLQLVSLIKPEITKLWKEILARAIWIRSLKKPVTSTSVLQKELAASPAETPGSGSLCRQPNTNGPAQPMQQPIFTCFPPSNQSSYWLRISPSSQVYCAG